MSNAVILPVSDSCTNPGPGGTFVRSPGPGLRDETGTAGITLVLRLRLPPVCEFPKPKAGWTPPANIPRRR